VILRPLGDSIILMPPLSIETRELEKLLEVTYDSIATVTSKL
jgi:adenosylmethionine-8-amino-7-oxononanoate aminotransferase